MAGLFVLSRVPSRIVVLSTEPGPTAIRVDQWAEVYRDQQWLKVSGEVRTERLATREQYAFVPVLPAGYRDGDPIQVVVHGGSERLSTLSGAVTVQGVLAPAGAWRLEEILPGYKLAQDVVVLNDGTEPDGWGAIVLMLILGVFFVWVGGRTFREALSND